MKLTKLSLPEFFKNYYSKFEKLTPIQKKAIEQGLLKNKSQLICAPTASGKTLVATMAIVNKVDEGKAIYLVPLKALANEKYNEYKDLFKNTKYKVIQSTGEIDSPSNHLKDYDVLILTTEKLDSLLRHKVPWINEVKTVIVDEIHLLNDPGRGPTLEVILTLLKMIIKPQIVGLSATIGNPKELAKWLNAELVYDDWRPIVLHKGVHYSETEFF
jgi:helicase